MGLDDSLLTAYETTDYWVDDAPCDPFCLRCGQQCPTLDRLLADAGLNGWIYITACNPASCQFSNDENVSRMQKLEAQLRALPCVIYHGRGVGTIGGWPPEPSLLVLGIREDEGLNIASMFGQYAIVIGHRGEPARLAWTECV
jgi:hypothetical protein